MDVNLRFRVTHAYARRQGFVGGVPTFYTAIYPIRIVYGSLLIADTAAEFRDLPHSALQSAERTFDPSDFGSRVRAVMAWARSHQYAAGFPTFHETIANGDYAYGAILFKPGTVSLAEVNVDELGKPSMEDIGERFRATQRYATERKFAGGFPAFKQGIGTWTNPITGETSRFVTNQTVLLPPSTATFTDLDQADLDGPKLADPPQHVRSMQREAVKEGFVGAVPTFYFAELGGFVCGTLLLDETAAEWRDIPLGELGDPPASDQALRFRAVHDYSHNNGFVGGYPTFLLGVTEDKVPVHGTILVNEKAAEWRDVAASQLGNPPDDDGPARFRGTQDFAVHKAAATGGFPNFYQRRRRQGRRVTTDYGTVLLRGPGVQFRDVGYKELFTDDVIRGAIRSRWESLGGPAGFLGLPLTEELGCADGQGRFNRFDGGVIYLSPETGAFEVHGAILERWQALGSERSYLGYPVTDELPQANPLDPKGAPWRVSRFQRGSIVWTGSGIIEVPDVLTKHASVTTPTGTPLGGWVDVTLWSNGRFHMPVHMHASGLPSYDFEIAAMLQIKAGPTLVESWKGHVNGSDSPGSRNFDAFVDDARPYISHFWDSILDPQTKLVVKHDYSPTGVVGFALKAGQAILDGAATAAGLTTGLVFGLTRDVLSLFPSLGPGETFGILDGIVVFAFGGGIVMAVTQGIAVGAVVDAMVSTRDMTDDEKDFARTVFQEKIPYDRIKLTNLARIGNRAFTLPGLDDKIYVHLADDNAYDNPMTFQRDGEVEGQLLIHELTHAWQIEHRTFLPYTICEAFVLHEDEMLGHGVYEYGPPGLDWTEFNLEQQASIVEHWFARGPGKDKLLTGEDDPYFMYIGDNIRKGNA